MKNKEKEKNRKKESRKKRVRANIAGSRMTPRLAVFKSAKHFYAQLIDDKKGLTLASASDLKVKPDKSSKKSDKSVLVGKLIADEAKKLNLKKVVFDKRSFKYHGRIKSFADSARENGLNF